MRIFLALILSLAASTGYAFEGSYTGQDQYQEQSLKIKKSSSGRYVLSLEVARPGCQGDIIVRGRVKGKTLIATHKESGVVCTLAVRKTRRGLNLTETDCWFTHGASCSYDGNYVAK